MTDAIECRSVPDCHDGCCHGLPEAKMIMLALMRFVIVVSYLLMLNLVKFAEGIIDKALLGRSRDAIVSDKSADARSH
jgi:hypothetical protein